MIDDSIRTCSSCGRLIVPGQKVCACGTRVSSQLGKKAKRAIDYGVALPLIPLVGAAGLFYLIQNPILVIFTSVPVLKIVAVTIIASAALALLVADRARKQDWVYANSPLSALSPASWFVSVLVIWPVIFPGFLHAHYRKVNPVRMIFGFVTTALFLLLLLWLLFVSTNAIPQWPVSRPANDAVSAAAPAPATEQPGIPAIPPDVLRPGYESPPPTSISSDAIVIPSAGGSAGQSEAVSFGPAAAPQQSSAQPNPQPAPSSPPPVPPPAPAGSTKSRLPMFSIPIIDVQTQR